MPLLKTCCCWNNVRSGSIACGVYTLILSIINTGIIAFNLNFLDQYTQSNHLDHYFQVTHNWFVAAMVVCVLLMVSSVSLILGVHVDSAPLLLPWLGSVLLMILIDTAALVYECLSFGLLTFNIIQMGVWLALSLLNIYCMMCVVSQYQELKAGRGTVHHLPQRRHMVYSSRIQEVHITDAPIMLTFPRGTILTSASSSAPPFSSSILTASSSSPPHPSSAPVLTSHAPGYAPSSHAPSSHAPSSHAPSSHAPSSHAPGYAPISHAPSSHAPSSHAPGYAPISHAPTGHAPSSHAPTSHAPGYAPSSHAPSSHAPSSHAPSSHAPSSHAPSSHAPSSHAPSSHAPSSHAPSSHAPGYAPSSMQTPPDYAVATMALPHYGQSASLQTCCSSNKAQAQPLLTKTDPPSPPPPYSP